MWPTEYTVHEHCKDLERTAAEMRLAREVRLANEVPTQAFTHGLMRLVNLIRFDRRFRRHVIVQTETPHLAGQPAQC